MNLHSANSRDGIFHVLRLGKNSEQNNPYTYVSDHHVLIPVIMLATDLLDGIFVNNQIL
jgi:hypothetical protein